MLRLSKPVCFLILCLILASCGKPLQPPKSRRLDSQGDPVQAASPSESPPGVPDLEPRILYPRAGADSGIPDWSQFDAPAALAQNWIESGGLWHARSAIPIQGRRSEAGLELDPLYLTWRQSAGDEFIENAFYSVDRESARGTLTTDSERRNPNLSVEAGRWYLPLRLVLPSDPNLIDGSDLYRVNLELHLRGHAPVRASVEFRIAPPVPLVHRRPIETGAPLAGAGAQRAFASGAGEEVLADELENPGNQSLTLWVGPARSARLRFGVKHVSHTSLNRAERGALAVEEHSEDFRSEAALRLDRLRIQPEGTSPSEVVLQVPTGTSDGFSRVNWGPHQKLRLSWVVSPPRSGVDPVPCSLPSPVPESFFWSDRTEVCRSTPRGEADICHFVGADYRADRSEVWKLTGARFEADSIPEVFVTAGSFSRTEWEAFHAAHTAAGAAVSSLYAFGINTRNIAELPASGASIPDSLPLATCQGLY